MVLSLLLVLVKIHQKPGNKLSFLGVTINKDENSKRGTEGIVSGKDSSITVMRIPTDEEYMICCDVEALMNK